MQENLSGAVRGYTPGVIAGRQPRYLFINTARAPGSISPAAKPMPLITAVCSVPVIAAVAALPVIGVVVSHPSSSDAYTVLGAVLASIVALIEARKKDRELSHTISVFLGSAAMGSFLPGIFYQIALWRQWLTESTTHFLTWQVWAFAGLLCGLNGWAMLHVINGLLRKRAEALRRRILGDSTDPENPTQKQP